MHGTNCGYPTTAGRRRARYAHKQTLAFPYGRTKRPKPPDGSVVIYPGVAVDHDGHTIIVSEAQRFQVDTGEAGTLHLVIQYREVADEMAHTGEGEEPQALYILEAYRLDGRLQIPEEDYIELARIQISGNGAAVTDAQNTLEPQLDEIDFRHRTIAGSRPLGQVGIGVVPLETMPDGAVRHASGALTSSRSPMPAGRCTGSARILIRRT